MVSAISLDSVSAKAQPKNNRDENTRRSGVQLGGSPCRRLKKAIRKIRNRRQTKTGPRMCRPTRRRKARASQPARSRKRLDAKFGRKQGRFDNGLAGLVSLDTRSNRVMLLPDVRSLQTDLVCTRRAVSVAASPATCQHALVVRAGAWRQRPHRSFVIELLPTAAPAQLLDATLCHRRSAKCVWPTKTKTRRGDAR